MSEARPPIVHLWLLAHHRPQDLDRCLLLPWRGRRIALCARCLGLYPTVAATLALQTTRSGKADRREVARLLEALEVERE